MQKYELQEMQGRQNRGAAHGSTAAEAGAPEGAVRAVQKGGLIGPDDERDNRDNR